MRPLIRRHPWMIIALTIMGLVVFLSLYEAYRRPPAGPFPGILAHMRRTDLQIAARGTTWHIPRVGYPNDPHPSVTAAAPALKRALSRVDFTENGEGNASSPTRILHRIRSGDIRSDERDVLLQLVEKNQEAWELIREGARAEVLGSTQQLRSLCSYTEDRLQEVPRLVTNIPYQTGPNPSEPFRPIFLLVSCRAALAIVDEDIESFLDALETGFNLAALLFDSRSFPAFIMSNIPSVTMSLYVAQQGLNLLPLDRDALQRLDTIIARACEEKSMLLSISYLREYGQALRELEQARLAACQPPRQDPGSYRRSWQRTSPYDMTLTYLAETWIPFFPLRRTFYLYELHQAAAAGAYFYADDEATVVAAASAYYYADDEATVALSFDRKEASEALRAYVNNPSSPPRNAPELSVVSALAAGLFEERLALWPYMDMYANYTFLLGQARVTRAAIASARFRLDQHRLPDSLEDLVPVYLASVPLDPHTYRQPLRYTRLTNRARITWNAFAFENPFLRPTHSNRQHTMVFELLDPPPST